MCRPRTKPIVRSRTRPIAAGLAAIALGTTLAGCSDLYFDRRDTVALGAGDAIAANEVAQTIDPWPAHSGNTSLAFNGQKMQTAVERYRTNTPWVPVTPVINPSQPTAQAVPPTQQTLSSSARRRFNGRGAGHRFGGQHHDDDGRHRRADADSRNASLSHAYWPIDKSGSAGQGGRSDRRRRIRGIGSRHVRRQCANRPRRHQGQGCRNAIKSTSQTRPSSSPISTPATRPSWPRSNAW